MSTEAWKEEHRAMVCCVCGERGPDTTRDEMTARCVAKDAGWWVKQLHVRQRTPKLEGSCAHQMQGLGSYASHRIEFEETRGLDYRGICPTCAGYVRSEVQP